MIPHYTIKDEKPVRRTFTIKKRYWTKSTRPNSRSFKLFEHLWNWRRNISKNVANSNLLETEIIKNKKLIDQIDDIMNGKNPRPPKPSSSSKPDDGNSGKSDPKVDPDPVKEA